MTTPSFVWILSISLALAVLLNAAVLYGRNIYNYHRSNHIWKVTGDWYRDDETESMDPLEYWAEVRDLLAEAGVSHGTLAIKEDLKIETFDVLDLFGTKVRDTKVRERNLLVPNVTEAVASGTMRALAQTRAVFKHRLNPLVFWPVFVSDTQAKLSGLVAISSVLLAAFEIWGALSVVP